MNDCNDPTHNTKGVLNKFSSVEGIVVIIAALGYVGMTSYSLVKWNAEISAALVTGFCLFAQSAISKFFDLLTRMMNVPNGTGNGTTAPAPEAPKA